MKNIKTFGQLNEVSKEEDLQLWSLVKTIAKELNKKVSGLSHSIKKATLLVIINDVMPIIMQDGNLFDDLDRKAFKTNKDKIMKRVLSELNFVYK